MARKPDSPCAGGCGRILWRGSGSLSVGEAKCRACRRRDGDWPRTGSGVSRTCLKCDRKVLARDLCSTHYAYWHRKMSGKWVDSGWISKGTRQAIYERDGWVCYLCSEKVDTSGDPWSDRFPSLDHILPRSLGGTDDESNLATAHRVCNSRKGAKLEV